MKPPKPPGRRSWKEVIRPYTERLQPVTKVAERITTIAVHLKEKPSLLSMAGLTAAGVNALDDLISNESGGGGYAFIPIVSKGHTLDAFRAAGATVAAESSGRRGGEVYRVAIHGMKMTIDSDGEIWTKDDPDSAFVEWLRQIFDVVLPRVLAIHSNGQGSFTSQQAMLTSMSSTQGKAIREATVPFLGNGGRCILLEGRPGVGKTTCAQEIAREANLGRVVLVNGNVVGDGREDGIEALRRRGPSPVLTDSFRVLSPGVIIVDDVDKVMLNLRHLESMRQTAKLVILTANNGLHDEVLDAALMRAGRIDEVFTIVPEHTTRRAPFDQLDDKTWEEVRDWPIAYLNEIEARLKFRSGDLRIDDLRSRVAKRTRSGESLFE